MQLVEAANLIQLAYDGKVHFALNRNGVQAAMVGSVLLIPGTNEKDDWFQFNLKLHRKGATRTWHTGFLDHAEVVVHWARQFEPRLIIGHSLGAASAQIVGYSMKVPTIVFGSPRPHRARRKFHGARYVLNICNRADLVCHVPPGFKHIGQVVWLRNNCFGEDHSLKRYGQALAADPPNIENWHTACARLAAQTSAA